MTGNDGNSTISVFEDQVATVDSFQLEAKLGQRSDNFSNFSWPKSQDFVSLGQSYL
jgi:hypothetical protein